jgi:hypothetical protein
MKLILLFFVIENYNMHTFPKVDNEDDSIYGVSVNIISIISILIFFKKMGYSDVLLEEVLNPCEENTSYYFPK